MAAPALRHRFHWSGRVLTGLLLTGIALCVSWQALPALAALQTDMRAVGEELLFRYRELSLDETFEAVATGIRFEPYAGVVRGPGATAMAHGGNAADQALLLAELLKAKGYRVRFVRGTLAGGNLETLLLGMYPPDPPRMDFPPGYGPFAPAAEPSLQRIARDHLWVEVDQGNGTWLPLDPTFPRARIGEAYAQAEARFDSLPEAMYQTLSVSVHEETMDGKSRLLGRLEARTADIGLAPLTLTEIGMPRFRPAAEPARKSAGDLLGGALAGGVPDEESEPGKSGPPPPLGVVIRRTLTGGQVAGSLLQDDNPGSEIRREWLHFEISGPDAKPLVVERDLFVADSPGTAGQRPPPFRRHSIVVVPGPIEPEAVDAYAAGLGETVDLEALSVRLRDLAATEPSGDGDVGAAVSLSEDVGLLTGQLVGLRVAAASATLTRRLAAASGVAAVQSLPRILIVSMSSASPSNLEAAIDLRLDQVDAWPYPGNARSVAEHFQTARGIQNSALEGFFVERILEGKEAANTVNLIARVEGGQSGMQIFSAAEADRLGAIEGLSAYSRRLIEDSLQAGREVIVPSKQVMLAGRPRLGWWDHDPATGRLVGVMDDGMHQAMAEYTLNTEKIGVNDDTAYVMGLILGATSTETLIAAKVLEKGAMTADMVADIEKKIAQIQCLSCPEASAKVSAGASVSVSVSGTCWELKKTRKVEKEAGAKAGISFCEKYTEGLTCASRFILNAYKASPVIVKTEAEAHVEASVKLPCQ